MRSLKKRVKARKVALGIKKTKKQKNTQSGDFIAEQMEKKIEETVIVVKPQDTPEEEKVGFPPQTDPRIEDQKISWMKRIVKNRKPDLSNKHVALKKLVNPPKTTPFL